MSTQILQRAAIPFPSTSGFSLLEVLAAVAIMAVGLVSLIGLHAAVTASLVRVTDAGTAARMGDAVRSRLLTLPHASVLSLIQEYPGEERNHGNPGNHPFALGANRQTIFGTREGEVGIYSPANGAGWRDSFDRLLADDEKFFEIDLMRNEELSPAAADALSTHVVFILRVRWPAFLSAASGTENPSGGVSIEHNRQDVLNLVGSISR